MTRRTFILESLAAVAAGGMGDVALAAVRGEPRLRLGVISDIHIHGGSDDKPEDLVKATESLLKAFRWFDAQGVDAVLIPGDLANLGRLPELQAVAATWEKAFPGGKGAHGRPVEQLFLYGNHDSWRHSKKVPNVYDDRKRHWEETFHEPYEDIRIKTVKGYDFILSSWQGWGVTDAKAFEAAKGCPLVAYDVGYMLKDKFEHLQFVAAGDFNLPPQEKKPVMDAIVVRRDRVPPDAVLAVRPVDCFGRIGDGRW